MKKMLIAGNWKMNTNAYEAGKLAETIVSRATGKKWDVSVLICPPYINIPVITVIIKGTKVLLGAQNCSHIPSGAFTGEISIPMLQYYGCNYVIIGHSERRQFFHETDDGVNEKLIALLNAGVNAIVCIGETLDERQGGKTFEVLERQIMEGLKNVSRVFAEKIVIAYEPVWAIGTGVSSEPHQVQEAHAFIRKLLTDLFGDTAKDMIIQYGGSVNEKNALAILELQDVNGALIGGASLKPDSFLSIIETAQDIVSS
ncbi:triose-phosphate isomerase [Bacteroidota bacterium]